jgi:CheY-like chemotaxis protein/two-component sensor histidine kinase
MGWSLVLSSTPQPDAALVRRAAEAIRRNVEHQARLIDDLLDTSRIISGKLQIEHQTVNLVEILQVAIELSRDTARNKNVELRFTAARPELNVVGDAGRLQQVATNLLSNAIKFTPEGGHVDIALQPHDSQVELRVSDTGIGIDADFLPHVFERFRQADTSTMRRYGGLGIGLALVRSLIELHGGTVAAASLGEGQGATFTVSLPAVRARERRPPPESEDGGHDPDALAGIRILLVDDDPDAREVLKVALAQAGALIRACATGRELVAVLAACSAEERPNVLLLDIAMPDEDGFTLLSHLRSRPDLPYVPAIAVTALTDFDRYPFAIAGFQDSIGKPVDMDRLIDAIACLSGNSESCRQAGLVPATG